MRKCVAALAMGIIMLSGWTAAAQPTTTVRQFFAECAKGRGDSCIGDMLAVESGFIGPFCSGVPPTEITDLPDPEYKAVTAAVIAWVKARPQILDVGMDNGLQSALRALYPLCKK